MTGARGVTGARMPDAVARYFDSVNAEDWDALEQVFTAAARVRPPGGRTRSGRAEVVAYYPAILAPFERHTDAVTGVHVDGDLVIVRVRFNGRTRDGAEVAFDAVDVFELEAGRIRRVTISYDPVEVSRQMGRGG